MGIAVDGGLFNSREREGYTMYETEKMSRADVADTQKRNAYSAAIN